MPLYFSLDKGETTYLPLPSPFEGNEVSKERTVGSSPAKNVSLRTTLFDSRKKRLRKGFRLIAYDPGSNPGGGIKKRK